MIGPLVPVIDLGDSPEAVAAQIGAACEQIGFFQIVGHGVAADVIDGVWKATRAFFEEPAAVRTAVAMPSPGYPYGYAGFEAEKLASSLGDDTPPDRKQTFSIGPIHPPAHEPTDDDEQWIRSPNRWPVTPAGFRAALETYYDALAELSARLLSHMADALGLAGDYFEPMIDQHTSALRCLDYPSLTMPPLPGQLRAGAHTDYGTLTILRTAGGATGLETQSPAAEWVAIDAEPDGFVVNLGDSLAQWTNDRWRSTVHRVVETPGAARRTSIAFFHNANWDAVIECLPGLGPAKHAPVRAGRHLMHKFQRTVAST